jgi:MYXO-CTERM domain-containing protein
VVIHNGCSCRAAGGGGPLLVSLAMLVAGAGVLARRGRRRA